MRSTKDDFDQNSPLQAAWDASFVVYIKKTKKYISAVRATKKDYQVSGMIKTHLRKLRGMLRSRVVQGGRIRYTYTSSGFVFAFVFSQIQRASGGFVKSVLSGAETKCAR